MATNNTEKSIPEEEAERSTEMLPYYSRVGVLFKQLDCINNNLTESQLNKYDEAELAVRLDYVENINRSYEKAQTFIEENESSTLVTSDRMSFVSLYFEVKAKLTRKITALNTTGSNQRSSTLRQFSLDEFSTLRKTKVPEIQLPKFCGSYSDWPNFFSLFSAVINDNSELTKLEKFHYLRASLGDAALDTIASLELNEANYQEALKILQNRFDNKLLSFQTHIKEIFSLNLVDNGSAGSLRRLSDKINAHLRALLTIGNQEQMADGFLIYLVSSKLDIKSKMKWEESLPLNELPTWDSMAKFLEQRCRMMENVENSVVNKTSHHKSFKKSAQHKHVHVSNASFSPLCVFCDSKDHFIFNCSRFGNLSPTLRLREAKRLRLCLNCLKKGHMLKACTSSCCRKCSSKHHTMLHIENVSAEQSVESPIYDVNPTTSQTVLVSASAGEAEKSSVSNMSVLLATAIVMVKNQFGNFVPCRAILDSASQLNLITNRFANYLRLKHSRAYGSISGIGDGSFIIDKSVDLIIKSCHEDFSTAITAMIVPNITDYQPSVTMNTKDWNIPKNLKLADPSFEKCGRIDILIGAELFFELMSVGQIKLAPQLPLLQKTLLGWVVAGGSAFQPLQSWSLAVNSKEVEQNEMLHDIVKGFWEVENGFEISESISSEDIFCEQHFSKNTVRLPTGEFSVRLPQVEGCDASALGNSYERALHRFKNLERKLKRSPDIKVQYIKFMREYFALNHMSLVSSLLHQKNYFLPHHCVQKLDSTSTKLRVVFDGSSKTTSGLSLNDVLHTGPTIQPKLFDTLLRYRMFKIALSGDICKMYRCVRVSHPDDYLQCILWRENEDQDIKIYKLNTVTYGTRPAAFLAIRAMQQLAVEEGTQYPLAAKIIKRDFYVDDLISGGNTIDEVVAIRQQVKALLEKGNFIIKKWCTNVPAVLNGVPLEQHEQFLKFNDQTDVTKTLGLIWEPKSDNFIYSIAPFDENKAITKRTILSYIARLYDPLGLLGPIITRAKMFMQTLWKLRLQWDESLPQSLHSSWLEYISKLDFSHNYTFPRYVSIPNSKIQIHAFCDASLDAYGACIYIRSVIDRKIKVSLLCSKSKVSPLKGLTVPKLELSAACLLADLVNVVIKALSINCEVHCWSDSTVVLSWIREQPSNFNVFVSNRISRIQTLTSGMQWHYVPSKSNPADILSRGATSEKLLHSTLWKCGPSFLQGAVSSWPESVSILVDLPEKRRNVLAVVSLSDLSMQCKYHNSFAKMQRIFAYIFKFLYPKLSGKGKVLTSNDIENGTHLLIKHLQLIHFSAEYKLLKANKSIPSSSKLYSLMPILDSFGLIRVGGRLQHSMLDFSAQHPIILPKHHPFTSSLVMHFHTKLLHAGPQALLASIRQQYWPIGGRKLVSAIIAKCIPCFKTKPILFQHVMGSLPSDRVKPNKAFHTTGIDYCGPFFYKSEVRNRPPVKCYISVFVCFSTKATHLEVVQDLTTTSFLCALRRFVATRGKPKTIWSDNATNFVGAKNELADLKRLFLSQSHVNSVQKQCHEEGIEWAFIPPRSPHFGGLWEAAVKSAKYHFYRTVGLNKLSFDELRTLVCEIAAVLNSRPLCPISEDPNDLEVLTPGHFLVGGPLISINEPNITETDFNFLNKWQKVSQLQQIFWRKWSTSYLSLLQERTKWCDRGENITCGAMVILKDENLPPLKWQLGRVSEVILGDDGVARVAIIRTSNGLVKRAVTKLATLPIDQPVESHSLSKAGRC